MGLLGKTLVENRNMCKNNNICVLWSKKDFINLRKGEGGLRFMIFVGGWVEMSKNYYAFNGLMMMTMIMKKKIIIVTLVSRIHSH